MVFTSRNLPMQLLGGKAISLQEFPPFEKVFTGKVEGRDQQLLPIQLSNNQKANDFTILQFKLLPWYINRDWYSPLSFADLIPRLPQSAGSHWTSFHLLGLKFRNQA